MMNKIMNTSNMEQYWKQKKTPIMAYTSQNQGIQGLVRSNKKDTFDKKVV